jgi:SAM-dependent methyltransferase
MSENRIRFDDGAAYERGMGGWSRVAGGLFLDWLAPAPGLNWLDVGCGNGAFTEVLVQRCAPAQVDGVDPSEAQLAFARTRPSAAGVRWHRGGAEALPCADASCDAAVMALVIFFLPDPAQGVAEMARVVRPGGLVAAYAWDFAGGGFPFAPVVAELEAMGVPPSRQPSPEASELPVMRALWQAAGLERVETLSFPVTRHFAGFDDYWEGSTNSTRVRAVLAEFAPAQLAELKERVRARLASAPDGSMAFSAKAHAVRGFRPG